MQNWTKHFDYLTKECKGRDTFVLYGWGTYPSNSVLAGQQSKQFLISFNYDWELEAFIERNNLKAEWSNHFVERQVSYHHLSDEGDY